jgi:hypothetical protein
MKKTTLGTLVLILTVLLVSLACGAVAPGRWDGTWVGITTQQERVELVVQGDTVTQAKFGAIIEGDGWEIPTEQSVFVKEPIGEDGSFHVRSESEVWLVELKGTFHEDRVEGVVVVTYLPAEKWEMLTFAASREV